MKNVIPICTITCAALFCACSGDRLAELGDLSLLGECELPAEFLIVDLDDVLNDSDAVACQWADSYVMFRGTVQLVNYVEDICECPEDCQCCNCADADLGMGDPMEEEAGITFINSTEKSVWCEGSNCGMFCYGMQPEVDYVVWGLFKCEPNYGATDGNTHGRFLHMDGFCKLSTEPDPTKEFVDKCNACINRSSCGDEL